MEFCLQNNNKVHKSIRHIYGNLYQGVAYSLTSIILQKVLIFKKSLFGKTVVLVHYIIWLRDLHVLHKIMPLTVF